MKQYKLTDRNMETYNYTRWAIGVEKETSGEGELCSKGWLHVYEHPLLAALLNPIHAHFDFPRLFECECSGKTKKDNGLKAGWTNVTLTKEIPLPTISVKQSVRFAILCVLKVFSDKAFHNWANDWLTGKDRSTEAAAKVAEAAAETAARAAAWAAAKAAEAAEWATESAAWAAAEAAKAAGIVFNLIKIAEEACTLSEKETIE
jgi:hypothetical protein